MILILGANCFVFDKERLRENFFQMLASMDDIVHL